MEAADRAALEQIIVGVSAPIEALRDQIRALTRWPLRSVLVIGETGSGKELVPRALLACSPHTQGRLEVFNCPAIAQDHLESELLGTTRGAFPGAVERAGAAERADGGVLFLDEVGAMPLHHQAKVLRLLESGEGRRLGASRDYRVKVSVVAATHDDLAAAVRGGRFRQDLYYRLVQDAVLRVPPLRERREDIPLLARHLLRDLPGTRRLAREADRPLLEHAWPGNVRELRAVLSGAARLAGAPLLRAEHVRAALERIATPLAPGPDSDAPPATSASFYRATRDLRRVLLIEAFEASGGNQTLAGLRLGLQGARPPGTALDLRTRKLAHRKFAYWWKRLVVREGARPSVDLSAPDRACAGRADRSPERLRATAS
jgi:transcriptional regulator with GAF, ATPase, and Fis domain